MTSGFGPACVSWNWAPDRDRWPNRQPNGFFPFHYWSAADGFVLYSWTVDSLNRSVLNFSSFLSLFCGTDRLDELLSGGREMCVKVGNRWSSSGPQEKDKCRKSWLNDCWFLQSFLSLLLMTVGRKNNLSKNNGPTGFNKEWERRAWDGVHVDSSPTPSPKHFLGIHAWSRGLLLS